MSALDLVKGCHAPRTPQSGGWPEALPFVRMFYGQPSVYLWEDEEGCVHDIHQNEGGEQGDALMCSLGQHRALEVIQAQTRGNERHLAYLDDIYIVTTPGLSIVQRDSRGAVQTCWGPCASRENESVEQRRRSHPCV